MEENMGEAIQPKELPVPEPYSLGYKVGDTLWVAGQTPVGDDGQVVGLGDPKAQAECIYRRIGLILKEAGAVPQDVTMIHTYLTDMRYQPMVREVRAAFFAGHKPASTSVQVVALAQPQFLMEVEVVAVIGQSKGA
jgi:enamine deaminase RidA (YjgF/YER057c/UK114 family)